MSPAKLRFAILVSALGYFVDVFDIILFNAVRVPSLKALGVPLDEITQVGMYLINVQVLGMFLGGFAWGMFGDKRGRLAILFGSILLYSTATLANAFVNSIEAYTILRFLAGFGLAGELGAGITLINEIMPKNKRGYGATLIVVCGALGGLTAGLVGDHFTWQTAYILGGVGGFVLLLLRVGVTESGLFQQVKQESKILKGSLKLFMTQPRLCIRYLKCLWVGVPFWIFVGIFIALSPEIAKAFQVASPVTSGSVIVFFCSGLALGEILSGLLSQYFKSRKKVVGFFLLMNLSSLICFNAFTVMDVSLFYFFCTLFGFTSGFWVLFVLLSSEQFGTNLRATVTTSLPNCVRLMVIPCMFGLKAIKPHLGILWAVGLVCITCVIFSFVALLTLEETFDKDMDFVEV